MGGEVAVAVRRRGRVEVRVVGTSSIQPLVHSLPFFEDGIEFSERDWDTGLRCPRESAPSPHGYGLVVIDADTRWVGSSQNFTSPGRVSVMGVLEERALEGEAPVFEAAWRAGHFSGVDWAEVVNGRPTRVWEPWAGAAKTLGWDRSQPDAALVSLESLMQASYRNEESRRLLGFTYAPPGWEFERFSEDRAGRTRFVETMLTRGFVFAPGSGATWRAYTETADGVVDPERLQAERAARSLTENLGKPVGVKVGARF